MRFWGILVSEKQTMSAEGSSIKRFIFTAASTLVLGAGSLTLHAETVWPQVSNTVDAPKEVPVLPPPGDPAPVSDVTPGEPAAVHSPATNTATYQSQSNVIPWGTGFGLQLGALAHSYYSPFGLISPYGGMGMNFLWGGRLQGDLPLGDHFVIRPSAGYFINNNYTLYTTYTEQDIELGLSIDYILVQSRSLRVLGGLAQRIDVVFFSQPYGAYFGGGLNPTFFQYRVGPDLSLQFPVTQAFDMTVNADGTFMLSYPSLFYTSLTLGFLYRL